jgi:hypothetical protein
MERREFLTAALALGAILACGRLVVPSAAMPIAAPLPRSDSDATEEQEWAIARGEDVRAGPAIARQGDIDDVPVENVYWYRRRRRYWRWRRRRRWYWRRRYWW